MSDLVALSVAISTLDRPDALARCLRSILAGSRRPGEIVVVDQSTDARTRDLVAELDDEQVSLVYVHDPGRGLGRSQNIAVSRATNDRVAVIDDDCVADNSWLAAIWNALEEVDVVAGRVLPLGPAAPSSYPVASRTSLVPRTFRWPALPWQVGSGNNFGFSRAWYGRVGGCDERLGPGSPGRGAVDLDLFYRLLRAGARVRYEPAAVVLHERKTRKERLERRVPYGYGMGACCTFWLREGDRQGVVVLLRWLALRLRLAARALLLGRWLGLQEETLVVAGTLAGVRYGLSAAAKPRGSGPANRGDHLGRSWRRFDRSG